ncbi:MAG: peptidylprolyl isomerase, partial [Anaerolineae bacterium]|nr:peptidylprolyl isomerase [Anaerolineae bacterium]
MAKRSTTGGPRTRRVTEADLQRRREYLSRAQREHMWQRRALITISVMIGISVLILAAALVYENVIRPNQPVSTVNGEKITTEDFQDRVRFLRWQTGQQIRQLYELTGDSNTVSQYASQLTNPIAIGSQVLDQMEEEILLKEEAQARGITIDEAAVDKRVDEFMAQSFGLTVPGAPTATPTTAPTVTPTPLVSPTPSQVPATATAAPLATPAEGEAAAEATEEASEEATAESATADVTPTTEPTAVATLPAAQIQATLDQAEKAYFENAQKGADVDRDTVRAVFYFDALQAALLDAIGSEAPSEEPQVHVRHILIAFDPASLGQAAAPATEEQKAAALEKANSVLSALRDGEPFAELAASISDDTSSAQRGGEMNWQSPDGFVPAFADAVKTAELGTIDGPIET